MTDSGFQFSDAISIQLRRNSHSHRKLLLLLCNVLGFFGTMLYVIIPLALFEVYVNLVFCVLVFSVGYAIGASGRAKKKQLRN